MKQGKTRETLVERRRRPRGAAKVDAAVKTMGEGNPLGGLADPREIGRAAVFLANDASTFITGVQLFADGGMVQVSGAWSTARTLPRDRQRAPR